MAKSSFGQRAAATLVLLAAAAGGGGGCTRPTASDVKTAISEVVQSQIASILSQVNWEHVMTTLHGQVGPDFALRVEGFQRTSLGVEISGHGAELGFNTQAQGGGGRDNSKEFPALMELLGRYQRTGDARKIDRDRLTREVIEAILRDVEARRGGAAGGQSPATAPGAQ